MEENLNNQSPEVEANTDEAPAERSIEEQLQAALGVAYKEREARKAIEKKAKESERRLKEYETKLAEKEQIASLWQDLAPPTNPTQPPEQPVARRPEYADLNHQLATKQIVSGLQEKISAIEQEKASVLKEKEDIIIESKLYQAFVEAGGLLPGDPSLVDVLDPKYQPFEVIKALTKEDVKYDPEAREVLFYTKDGSVELNKHGVPITPREKMEAYKQLKVFESSFKSDNQNKGMGTPFNGKSVGTGKVTRVSLSGMRKGQVKPEDVLKADYFVE